MPVPPSVEILALCLQVHTRRPAWQPDLACYCEIGTALRTASGLPRSRRDQQHRAGAEFRAAAPGWGDVNLREPAGSSNYHSLQVSANRRFSSRLQYGMSYTWSKCSTTTPMTAITCPC